MRRLNVHNLQDQHVEACLMLNSTCQAHVHVGVRNSLDMVNFDGKVSTDSRALTFGHHIVFFPSQHTAGSYHLIVYHMLQRKQMSHPDSPHRNPSNSTDLFVFSALSCQTGKRSEGTSRARPNDSMHAYISPHGAVVDRWDAIVSTRPAVCREMGRDGIKR